MKKKPACSKCHSTNLISFVEHSHSGPSTDVIKCQNCGKRIFRTHIENKQQRKVRPIGESGYAPCTVQGCTRRYIVDLDDGYRMCSAHKKRMEEWKDRKNSYLVIPFTRVGNVWVKTKTLIREKECEK